MNTFKFKRKSYGMLLSPADAISLPVGMAKSGYDDIIDNATETAKTYVPRVKNSSVPIKKEKIYSPSTEDDFGRSGETVGKVVGSATGTATGAALGGATLGLTGVGVGMKSAAKTGSSLSMMKKGGKLGMIGAGAGILAGGLLGHNKGKEVGGNVGSSAGESVGRLFSITLKRKSYAGIGSVISGIKSAAKTIGSKAKPLLDKTPEPLKDVGKFAWKNKGSMVGGLVMGSGLTAGSYVADKAIQKDMAKNGQTIPNTKSYSVLGGLGKTILNGAKKAPEQILSGASSLMGGGGRKGVGEFSSYMKSSGSKSSRAIGDFIEKHPKTSLAASIPVGATVLGATWGVGEKGTKKIARAADKNAFKYTDSKSNEIN